MMYRNFAIATVLAAPIIVMLVQSFTPQAPVQPPTNAVPVPVETAPATGFGQPPAPQPQFGQPQVGPPPVPVPSPSEFGKPMGDAGQPSLTFGSGQPTAPQSAAPPAQIDPNQPIGQ